MANDRGSASIEMAILAPAVIAVFVMLFLGGRTMVARQAIDAAAYDAARTASLARDAPTAITRARAAAVNTLNQQGLSCSTLNVVVDTAGFRTPVGQPATVRATITCVVRYRDLALPGMPGSATLTATFVSPLDSYRSRA
jgi:Flp pilus assembly protein TadG